MFRNTGQKAVVFMLLFSILLAVLPLAAYGERGDGTGNSQGVFKPLSLESATLEDGTSIMEADNVPLQPKITMHFDKNVVYLIYWERNKRCFHLYDESGREQELKLSKIDDTVDFSKRQYIWVEPAKALAPGTSYKLYVAPDLLAKNGGSTLSMTTGNQGVTIKFRTAGEKKVNNPEPAASGEGTPAAAADGSESAAPPADAAPEQSAVTSDDMLKASGIVAVKENNEAASSGPVQSSETDAAKYAAFEQGRRVQNEVAAGAGVLLAVWLVVEVLRRKRKRG